ncbi:MAG TPA: bifunctional DNA primase/polymerase [Xanthobacteraceae bacterium]|nr:bifunctional DNA primase/polymerase [Xanthobacteraceae bacterium]
MNKHVVIVDWPNEQTSLLDAAIWYAAHGFAVFPIRPLAKEPLTGSNGHLDATTNANTIRAWWTQTPDANIGVSPAQSGMFVLDQDGTVGAETIASLELEHGLLPLTLTFQTPRGPSHLHRWYRGKCPTSVGRDKNGRITGLGAKLDTRGYGGYVLLPPSRVVDPDKGIDGVYSLVNDCAIERAPAWIAEVLARNREGAKSASDVELDLSVNVDRATTLLRGYVERGDVAVEGAGGDDRTYQLACEVLSLGLSVDRATDIIWRIWNPACEPPWDKDELGTKIRNASEYMQNDVGAWAVDAPEQTYASFAGNTSDADTPRAPQPSGDGATSNLYRYRLRDLRGDAEAPAPVFRDPNKLWLTHKEGVSTLVIAAPKAGKTNIILAEQKRLMLSGSARTLIAAVEGAFENGNERIPALIKFYEPELDKLRGDQDVWSYLAGRFRQADLPFFALDNQESVVALVEFANREAEQFGLGGWTDLVIDTQRRASGALDENSAKDINRLWDSIFFLRDHITYDSGQKCNITVVHHVGKDAGRGASGSLAQYGHATQVFQIKSDKEAGTAELTVTDRRSGGKDGFSVLFKAKHAPGSTWPIMVPMDAAEIAKEREKRKGAFENGKYRIIPSVLRDSGAVGEGHAVVSSILAENLLREWGDFPRDPGALADKVRSVSARLAEAAKQERYRAYLLHAGGEMVKPYKWFYPEGGEQ